MIDCHIALTGVHCLNFCISSCLTPVPILEDDCTWPFPVSNYHWQWCWIYEKLGRSLPSCHLRGSRGGKKGSSFVEVSLIKCAVRMIFPQEYLIKVRNFPNCILIHMRKCHSNGRFSNGTFYSSNLSSVDKWYRASESRRSSRRSRDIQNTKRAHFSSYPSTQSFRWFWAENSCRSSAIPEVLTQNYPRGKALSIYHTGQINIIFKIDSIHDLYYLLSSRSIGKVFLRQSDPKVHLPWKICLPDIKQRGPG